jgi:hypothetical protein
MDTKNADKLLNKTMYNVRPEYITDTVARTGLSGFAIQILEESVIASISYNASATSNAIAAETLAAGLVLYLPNISAVTLTSGAVIVYQSEK